MAGEELSLIGKNLVPSIFASLGVFTDLMAVVAEITTVGTGGGTVKSAGSMVYSNVPCLYIRKEGENKLVQGDKLLSTQEHELQFPVYAANGTRISIDPVTHRLVLAARGNEPSKTFRIVSISDGMGTLYQASCIREN